LGLVEFRVLKLICSGYSLAKEIVKGYTSKYGEAISLQAIERTLTKLRVKGLVNGKHSGRALVYEETELGRLIACS
jgi:DNA-binding PadR family transcriptional regulator